MKSIGNNIKSADDYGGLASITRRTDAMLANDEIELDQASAIRNLLQSFDLMQNDWDSGYEKFRTSLDEVAKFDPVSASQAASQLRFNVLDPSFFHINLDDAQRSRVSADMSSEVELLTYSAARDADKYLKNSTLKNEFFFRAAADAGSSGPYIRRHHFANAIELAASKGVRPDERTLQKLDREYGQLELVTEKDQEDEHPSRKLSSRDIKDLNDSKIHLVKALAALKGPING